MLFQIAALAVLLVFYGCYFLKMLLQRKKGIRTDQIGVGKSGTVKRIELVMKLITISVPVAEIVCIAANQTALPTWCRILGCILCAAGDVMFILAVLTMRDNWRAGVPETDRTELVTDGIFRISRNPAFLGFDLVYTGILLMFFHPVLLVLSALAVMMLHLQIVFVEEQFLLRTFGEDYRQYMHGVNRYLGIKKGNR